MTAKKNQASSVNINSESVTIKGDIIGHDKVTSIFHGSNETGELLLIWQKDIISKIKKNRTSKEEKDDLIKQVGLIKSSIEKEKGKNPKKLEGLINILAIMSPDIFEVAVATLANPLAGIGVVLKKIGDKAKVETLTK